MGRDPAGLAREFEPSAQAIRNWVREAGRGGGPGGGVAAAVLGAAEEEEELTKLRREVRRLRLERDILSKREGDRGREAA